MSQWTISLTANAGVVVTTPACKLWFDAAHQTQVPGFSTVSPSLWRTLLSAPAYAKPDFIIYSHSHPDHYARVLTAQALQAFPQAELIAPFADFSRQTLLQSPQETLSRKGAVLHFAALPHEPGPHIRPLPHYGCLAEIGERRLLFPGDCAVEHPALVTLAGDRPIDVAVVNFPWLTLRRGRDFLRNFIHPRHLVVCHLPFSEDDTSRYRDSTLRAASRQTDFPDVRLLLEPLQTECFDL